MVKNFRTLLAAFLLLCVAEIGLAGTAISPTGQRAVERPRWVPNEIIVKFRTDLSKDHDAVEKLFEAYVAAKEKAGENVKKLRLVSFEKVIAKQVKGFQAKGAEHVQFQVETKDGKVKLKAGRAK